MVFHKENILLKIQVHCTFLRYIRIDITTENYKFLEISGLLRNQELKAIKRVYISFNVLQDDNEKKK